MNAFLRSYGLFIYFLLLSLLTVVTGNFIFDNQSDPVLTIEMQTKTVIPYAFDITFIETN